MAKSDHQGSGEVHFRSNSVRSARVRGLLVGTASLVALLAACSSTDGGDDAQGSLVSAVVGTDNGCTTCPTGKYISSSTLDTACATSGGIHYWCQVLPATPTIGTSFTACGASSSNPCPAGYTTTATTAPYKNGTSDFPGNANCLGHASKAYTCSYVTSASTSVHLCGGTSVACPAGMYKSQTQDGDTACVQETFKSVSCTAVAATTNSVAVCGATCPADFTPDIGSDTSNGTSVTGLAANGVCKQEDGLSITCRRAAVFTDADSVTCGSANACPVGTFEFASRKTYAPCSGQPARLCRPMPTDTSTPRLCGSTCPDGYYAASSTLAVADCALESGKAVTCAPIGTSASITACGTTCPTPGTGAAFYVSASARGSASCANPDHDGHSRTCTRIPTSAFTMCFTPSSVAGSCGGGTDLCAPGTYLSSSQNNATNCADHGGLSATCTPLPSAVPSTVTVCDTICPTNWNTVLGTDVTTNTSCLNQLGRARQCSNAAQSATLVCKVDNATANPDACGAGTYEMGSRNSYYDCLQLSTTTPKNGKARFCAVAESAESTSKSNVITCGDVCPTNWYATTSVATQNDLCQLELGKAQTCNPYKSSNLSSVTACGATCPTDASGNGSYPTGSSLTDTNCDTQNGQSHTCTRVPSSNVVAGTTFTLCKATNATCPQDWFESASNTVGSGCVAEGNNTITCKNLSAQSPGVTLSFCGATTCPAGWTLQSNVNDVNCTLEAGKAAQCKKN